MPGNILLFDLLTSYDQSACQAFSGVSGRLGAVIVGVLVDNDCFSDHICRPEAIGEEIHPSVSAIGQEDRQISCVMRVGLVGRIPVLARGLKGIGRIADGARAFVMHMEAKKGAFMGRKTAHFYKYIRAIRDVGKHHKALQIGSQRTALNLSVGLGRCISIRGGHESRIVSISSRYIPIHSCIHPCHEHLMVHRMTWVGAACLPTFGRVLCLVHRKGRVEWKREAVRGAGDELSRIGFL